MADRSRAAISLFSGGGGLDLGLQMTGFDFVFAIDNDRDAVATYCRNFPRATVLQRDVLDMGTEDIRDSSGLTSGDAVELVAGGPPCAPFSKSALWLEWKRRGLDPDSGLVNVFGQYVVALRPRFCVFENVPLFASPASPYRHEFLRLLQKLRDAGYALSVSVLNAADTGVAQLRRRLFVVGTRDRQPSQGGPLLVLPTRKGYATCAEAFEGLRAVPEPEEAPSGKWAHLLEEVPPGKNYLVFTERAGHAPPLFEWRSRYWSFLLKLHPDHPSPTIQAQPGPATGPFHWDNRRLRVGELMRLFGYPDDYVFMGSRAAIQRQIGNSVPPPLARAVGACLLEEGTAGLF